jgi:membrane-bound ClpP family serine protease
MQLFLLFIFCLSLFAFCILSFTLGISPLKPTSPVLLILCSASVLLIVLFFFQLHRAKATKITLDLIGKVAIVQTELNPQGAIIINGDLWLAMTNEDETISVGKKVKVVNLKGHMLQVDSIAFD